ncbi:hypothetical protein BDV93DRAFT_496924 [Ceratobasidium sp. AG-I]|nr:hypothetical protein BDV93DRAFT_496924 [Ceratobasidium sp. AG-I]
MFSRSILSTTVFAAITSLGVASLSIRDWQESHTITFQNNCGKGTPQLQRNGKILSTGEPFTQKGRHLVATAWLATDGCGPSGENCTLVELDLMNAINTTTDSSTNILIADQYKFSVPVKFQYFGSCSTSNECLSASCCPQGAVCNDSEPDNMSERLCLANNANVAITFCP